MSNSPMSAPMPDGPYARRMVEKLTAAFAPSLLEIKDDSHKHAGHADRIAALGPSGHAPVDGGGETHFRVTLVSAAFVGQSRVQRQRMVYDVLRDELRERVHALALTTKAPGE